MALRDVQLSIPSMGVLAKLGQREVPQSVSGLAPPSYTLPDGAKLVAADMIYDGTYSEPLVGVYAVVPAGQVGGDSIPPSSVTAVASATSVVVNASLSVATPQAWVIGLDGIGYTRRVWSETASATFSDVPAGLLVTPTARTVIDSVISSETRGTAVQIVEAMSVTGNPVITGGDATEGEVIGYTCPTASGVAQKTQRWIKSGAQISTATTLNTTGHVGSIVVEVTLVGFDGSTVVRSSAPITVSAASSTVPSAPQSLRVGTTTQDGLPITMDPPVSAGSSPVTGYRITYIINGVPTTVSQSGRDFLLSGLNAGVLTIKAQAQNASGYGPETSTSLRVFYLGRLSRGTTTLSFSSIDAAWVPLEDLDRTRGTLQLVDQASPPGSGVIVRDNNGATMSQQTAPISAAVMSITTQRAVCVTATSGAPAVFLTPYTVSEISVGSFSAVAPASGSAVTVVTPPTFNSGFRPATMVVRYGLRYVDKITGPDIVVDDDPPSSSTTSTSLTIASGKAGKFVGVLAYVYEAATGAYPIATQLLLSSGGNYAGPIASSNVSATVTQSTSETTGEVVLTSSISGFQPERGIRMTVSAMTDGGSGGVGVFARTPSGAEWLTAIAATSVGSVYDLAPPNAVLPSDVDAIVLTPAGAGTYSYTLTFTAL